MKGNDYQPTTGVQAVKGVVQRLLQYIQFTVNLNANRLKGASSRVAVTHGSLGHTGFNNIHQLECSLNGLFLPGFYNIGGNAAAEFFLPIAVENIRQRSLVISIDHIRALRPVLLIRISSGAS